MKSFDLILIVSASVSAVLGCATGGIASRGQPAAALPAPVELRWQRRADEVACHSVAFSPDGELLAVGGDGTNGEASVTLWSKAGELVQTLTGHRGHVTAVTFSPNGEYLASGSGLLGYGVEIRIWRGEGWHFFASLLGHTGDIRAVAFSPSGHHLVSASFDMTPGPSAGDNCLRLWALYPAPHAVATLSEFRHGVEDAVWLTCQKVAVALYGEGIATVSLTDHKARHLLPASFVTALDRWTHGTLVAGLRNGTLMLLDSSNGDVLWRVACSQGPIEEVAVAPKTGLVAAASADGCMSLVDLHTGERVFTKKVSLEALYCVAVTEIGCGVRIATSGSDGIVRVWELQTSTVR